jgi:tetratricopeptide (TPR) repeat protein
MRRFCSRIMCTLSFLGLAATSEADMSGQGGQSGTGESNAAGAAISPEQRPADPTITVTGKVPLTERPLPTLPPTEFTDCIRETGGETLRDIGICAQKLDMERHIVLERCLNRSSNTTPPMVIQACTASLDHNILEGKQRLFLLVNRAEAYFIQGDRSRALDDYNEAVGLAPSNATLYYNRGPSTQRKVKVTPP